MVTYLAVELISHGLVLVSQHACQALLLLEAPRQLKLLLQAGSPLLRAISAVSSEARWVSVQGERKTAHEHTAQLMRFSVQWQPEAVSCEVQ